MNYWTRKTTGCSTWRRGPLFRATLCKLSDAHHFLAINFHHIILDGWSIGLFIEEFSKNYALLVEGKQPESDPLNLQYRDFAAWQNGRSKSDGYLAAKAYWQQQLASLPEPLRLPLDHSRQAARSTDGAITAFEIPRDLFARLQRVAVHHGASMYVIILAAVYATLAPYSDSKDILLGAETADRSHPDLQKCLASS